MRNDRDRLTLETIILAIALAVALAALSISLIWCNLAPDCTPVYTVAANYETCKHETKAINLAAELSNLQYRYDELYSQYWRANTRNYEIAQEGFKALYSRYQQLAINYNDISNRYWHLAGSHMDEVAQDMPGESWGSINVTNLAYDEAWHQGKTTMWGISYSSGRWVSLGEFRITHYCTEPHHHICNDGDPTTTARGNRPIPYQTIAVDPTVIPFGSRIRIYGSLNEYIADDTGGAIRGNRIDRLVTYHQQARDLGVIYAEVWIWEEVSQR